MPRPQRKESVDLMIFSRGPAWEPGGSIKRWSSLVQSCRPTLNDTRADPLAQAGHDAYTYNNNTLMHLPSTHGQPAYFWTYAHALVRTCVSRVFHAFMVVCDWGCVA